ncbi:ATP-dependent helicase C-terminal domain-containing protein [Amycolatopsis thermophila]|uniref:ATP-dependent helicase HrpB n=1 Tax=Amycolatopsis thermophila TaxID=206084 RepID=A0ABU0EP63_9PSEU|nr:ATP-dependent helicase C-terminal domain-containing protein [Amycolatopsis thermophila]MDQ0377086.1 ATP-dependent helicase HrpB [Amycolatopsis thermophila]
MNLPDLPVRAVLGELAAALDGHGAAVLVAPPGTGKTTIVPLDLMTRTEGRIVVAEPRRLAARAAAARMAALLGEPVGETVGYAVRGDRKVSKRTRVEVVTSGLLVRRVQNDPELPGVSTVLLDECHERHLDADLLLALLLDVRGGLRDDLRLLATSATVASGRLAELLGGAPVVTARARTYPVEVTYVPPARGERVEACVARAVRTALADGDGDVLAFLPGAGEIARVGGMLDLPGVDVVPLHGRLAPGRQDAALRPGDRRRVVLATAVAESSLTVPGVRAVVDSGQARVPRVDHRRGLPGLATVRVSAAVAEQRAGRAGREAPGRAYRCWPQHEQAGLTAYPEPEIRTAELARLALELACWSTPDGAGLSWWDPPPAGPLAAGQDLLRALGALDGDRITDRGRRMAELGLHPRLARALLDGAAAVGAHHAAEVVALMDAGATLTDVDAELRRLRSDRSSRWHADVRRLERLVPRRADHSDTAWSDLDRPGPAARGLPHWAAATTDPVHLSRSDAPPRSSGHPATTPTTDATADHPNTAPSNVNRPASAARNLPQRTTATTDPGQQSHSPASSSGQTATGRASDATAHHSATAPSDLSQPGPAARDLPHGAAATTDPRQQSHSDSPAHRSGQDSTTPTTDATADHFETAQSDLSRPASAARNLPQRTTATTGPRQQSHAPAPTSGQAETARASDVTAPGGSDAEDPALVVALAYPERLARRRAPDQPVYLMAGGTAAELPAGSGLGDAEWLAVAEATRDPGRAHGVIRLAARADEDLAVRAAPNLVTERDEVTWSGDVVARRVRRLGAIVLRDRPLRDPDPALVRAALLTGLRDGDVLTWTTDADRLRSRIAFLHDVLGDPWPAVDDETLLSRVDDWLEPELSRARRRADLARIDTASALRRLLPWPEAGRLDELAPDRIQVPSGARFRVDYTTGRPVLAVKLQLAFGWRDTPKIAGGRVPVVLHLLSPAGRPAAVTSDLESFWANGYQSVRAELRGRYPKHAWPADPHAP